MFFVSFSVGSVHPRYHTEYVWVEFIGGCDSETSEDVWHFAAFQAIVRDACHEFDVSDVEDSSVVSFGHHASE